MCKRFVYLFLVFAFCLTAARADLTLVPLTSWEITGDFGDILSLNGYSANRLIVGSSAYATPPGQSGNEPAEGADDLTLDTSACADGQEWMQTVFEEPVNMIFILEKNGNDSGTIQGLDASGNPVGNALAFTGGSLYWASTGYLASQLSTQQIAFGAVLTSDISIYGILITAPGIDPVSILAVGGQAGLSSKPVPANGATDVPRDTLLSWASGKYAQTHDVYFGTVFDDVNDADRANPLGVLLSQGQIANMYDPGILDFGQTYFWRVDEANAVNSSLYKGNVWSFQVEPLAYLIPSGGITPTASSSESADTGPEKTIDGSGLADDLHSVDTQTMWLTDAGDPGPVWIQYDFSKPYKLHHMLVWNYNGPSILAGYGLKDVVVEYSEDGAMWTVLPNANEFAQASGTDGYAANTTIDFGGVAAQSVRITANSNWGGSIFTQYGLSEVRFSYIPIRARYPSPDLSATDVAVDATLSWRAGRQAAEHDVYLSTDEQAVIDGTVAADTVTASSYGPLSLDLDTTYYWKISEVNMVETPSMLEGDLWSFSTQEFIAVDDFESYNDIDPPDPESHRIFESWIDGFGTATNGALVGYDPPQPSYAETVIVHGGDQSMPLSYNNTGGATYSEAERAFVTPQDWTEHGIATLALYFYGTPGNTGQLYVKINGTKVLYGGDAADIARPRWKQWNIDLASLDASLQNVTKLGIGIDGSGAAGTLYVDDIRLYSAAPAVSSEEIWLEAEAADTITPPMTVFSAIPGASGGQYIEVESGNNSTGGPPTTGGVASYKIDVQAGAYKINCRVIAPSTSNDSLWFRIQGATTQTANHSSGWVRWNDIAGGSYWHWDTVHSSEDGNTEVEWTMASGTYTLEIAYREEGVLLDTIVIGKID